MQCKYSDYQNTWCKPYIGLLLKLKTTLCMLVHEPGRVIGTTKRYNCHSYHFILHVVINIIWYDSNLSVVAYGLTQLFEVSQFNIYIHLFRRICVAFAHYKHNKLYTNF